MRCSGSTNHTYLEPVLAWNDNGDALILGRFGLVEADSDDRFVRLEWSDPTPVACVAGQGWRARLTYGDGSRFDVPVLQWVTFSDREATAYIADGDGNAIPIYDAAKHYETYHPDEREEQPPADAVAA
jgi:hypothetical protein